MDVVQVLLEYGADCLHKNMNKQNSFHITAEHGNNKLLNLMYEHLLKTSKQKVKYFLDNGRIIDGWTPLHFAIEIDDYDVIRFVLKKINISSFEKDNTTKMLQYSLQGFDENALSLMKSDIQYKNAAQFIKFLKSTEKEDIFYRYLKRGFLMDIVGLQKKGHAASVRRFVQEKNDPSSIMSAYNPHANHQATSTKTLVLFLLYILQYSPKYINIYLKIAIPY